MAEQIVARAITAHRETLKALDAKLAALREHRSQMGDWDPKEFLVEWAREQGVRGGLEAAEAYRHMVLEGP